MQSWLIPPIVVPALLALLVGIYAALRAPI
jgi:hypothetical protein